MYTQVSNFQKALSFYSKSFLVELKVFMLSISGTSFNYLNIIVI